MYEDYSFFPFRQMPFPQGYPQQMVPGGMTQGGMMPGGMTPGGMMQGGMTQGGMSPGGFVPGTTASPTSPGFLNPTGGSPTPQFFGSDMQGQGQQQAASPFEMAPGSPVEQGIEYTQGYLRTQIGKKVRVEFLLGTNTIQDRRGTLLQVGISYIILREEETDDLLMCDIYSIKFVTIYR